MAGLNNMLGTLQNLGVSAFKDSKPISGPSVGGVSMSDFVSGKRPDVGPVANPGSSTYYVSAPPYASSSAMSGVGALLSGVSGIVGGLLSYKEQKKANKIAEQQFRESMAFQKDQYYNDIQNRLVDAKKAGVHPLAALGISAHGSASPTAHVQAATGLGQAASALSGSVNSYFENAQRFFSLQNMAAQIAATKALEVKYMADAGRAIASTDFIRKDLANYNVYRVWDRINSSISSATRLLRPPVFQRTYNYDNRTEHNINPIYQDIY